MRAQHKLFSLARCPPIPVGSGKNISPNSVNGPGPCSSPRPMLAGCHSDQRRWEYLVCGRSCTAPARLGEKKLAERKAWKAMLWGPVFRGHRFSGFGSKQQNSWNAPYWVSRLRPGRWGKCATALSAWVRASPVPATVLLSSLSSYVPGDAYYYY